jgi:hypothetical protein
MRKILILLLCIFGLSFGYTQVKNVKVNVPSNVIVTKGDDYTVCVMDSSISKYITMRYKDSTLYINSLVELIEPIKIRIVTPDSLSITTNRNHKITRR